MEAQDECGLPGIQSIASLHAKLNSSDVTKATFPAKKVMVVSEDQMEDVKLGNFCQESEA